MPRIRTALLAAAVLTLAFAAPARADSTAFWGYWQVNGSAWAFAKTGPADAHPQDGAVEGWRFARSNGNAGTPPRGEPGFAKVCGPTAAKAGSKRIAVVIDDGDRADAPHGQTPAAAKASCAVVPRNATGADVLAAVAKPQTDKSGLICAIDAFGPCGTAAAPAAASPSASAHAPQRKSSGSTGLSIGIGLVLLLAAAGSLVALQRRSRR
jgi:hypothetical protein